MSSFIQFIIAVLSRFRERLISDRPAIELILSKIIQIDHIELFFRFLEAIMQNTSLQEFNQSGYMSIFVRGSQALGQSIQGRKATLLFVSKLIVHYGDHMTALQMVPFFLSSSTAIATISTINSWRRVQTSSSPSLPVATANSSSWQFAKPLTASTPSLMKLLQKPIARGWYLRTAHH